MAKEHQVLVIAKNTPGIGTRIWHSLIVVVLTLQK